MGWVLDVYIGKEDANLWVKLDDGRTVHLTDSYRPDFYAEVREGIDPEEVAQNISLHPGVFRAEVDEKYASILQGERSKVVHVLACDTSSLRSVRNDLERLGVVRSWFNVDLYHFQRYLFSKTIVPTSKVRVEWSERGKLVDVAVIDDSSEIKPPPFSCLLFEAGIESRKPIPIAQQNPIERLILQMDNGKVEALKGAEADVLAGFNSLVASLDPDFLIASDCENALRYIFERARILDIELQIGREPFKGCNLRRVDSAVRGRALVDSYDFLGYGVAGICEFSRFTLAPPAHSAKWAAGKRIDARQSFEALKRDILLPRRRGFPRFAMTAREIHEKDKGGLLISPVEGLHENVAELDFESMFPNIIIRHNISYETVTPTRIDVARRGFLGEVVETVLDRRLRFKHLRKRFPKSSKEYLWCNQRQKALKCVLVCIYGFSGCFANRFNNLAVYNQINAVARRMLIQTANICLAGGFEVLYGNTDSIFVKLPDATRKDYVELAKAIQRETGLAIALDKHYQFIVFMRKETRPDVEAMNRFYGKLTNGGLNCRGIELRRRDCPVFLKEFQRSLIELLFDAKDRREIMERQVPKAKDLVHAAHLQVINGEIDPLKLAISKHIRKKIDSYNSLLPHVVAARHLTRLDKSLEEVDTVDFVYVNAEHSNPMRRVLPTDMMGDECGYYDREKYRGMVLDAAETVLSTFDFSKQSFCGKNPPGRPRRLLTDFNQE